MPLIHQGTFYDVLGAILALYFLWLPIVLVYIFWILWVYYVRSSFVSKIDWVLLEIKLPREIHKTPKAMEVVFNALHNTSDGGFFMKYWNGFVRSWFSLEIASINGDIHFFVYAQRFFRNLVESQIYSQYPDVEIIEVDDYAKLPLVPGFKDEWDSFGMEFGLIKEDVYPIKTYVDYGLHETMTKEEQKIDPITSFLEVMGSLKEGEQIWFQVLALASRKNWKSDAEKAISKLSGNPEDEQKPSPGTGEAIKAIEKNVSKLGFEVGVRAVYLAKKDKFNQVNIPAIMGVMKQYNTQNLNGFKPTSTTSVDFFFKNRRERVLKSTMIDAYRKRSCFHVPYEKKTFVFNTEELATVYHFPGRVAETPTFGRVEAKKGEAPSNLPV